MSGALLWLLIIVLALSTFLLRGSFLLFPNATRLHASLKRALPFVPAAVLAALIAPAVFRLHNDPTPVNLLPRIVAASLALLVAYRTNNILLTLAVGMLSLWGLRWLIHISMINGLLNL